MLALFVVLQVPPLQPQAPAQSGNHTANTQGQQKPEQSPAPAVMVNKRESGDKGSDKDPVATQDPDKWVRRGFWINAGLTVITLIIAVATLLQAFSSKKSATAQMNADRAWVLIHGIRNPPPLDQCRGTTAPGIVYEVKVCGNTPARIVRERYRCRIVPAVPGSTPPEPQIEPVPTYKSEASHFGVDDIVRATGTHWGVSIASESGILTFPEFLDLQAERSFLVAYGCIEYKDAFGRDGITKFFNIYRFASGGVMTSPDGTRLSPDSGFRTENRPGYSQTT